MISSQSLFLFALLSFVAPIVGQNSTNSTNSIIVPDFKGPGYLSCPIADFNSTDCEFDIDPTCSNILACNFTAQTEQLDETYTILHIPLNCDCVVAYGCPYCTFNTGDIPTLPPVTSGRVNFTGIGSVTCPIADIYRAPCEPEILGNNAASCGTCDGLFTDDDIGYTEGDKFITFPLPCECLVMYNCPDTCAFNGQVTNGTAPTPIVIAAPEASPTVTPAATVLTPTTEGGNVTAPISTPTTEGGNVTAPISTPTTEGGNVTVPIPTPTTEGGNVTASISTPTTEGRNVTASLSTPIAALTPTTSTARTPMSPVVRSPSILTPTTLSSTNISTSSSYNSYDPMCFMVGMMIISSFVLVK
jgi:hypothetical protein